MSFFSTCGNCPLDLKSRCSRFNYPLHHPKKKGEEPVLSEVERACILLKHIYVIPGKEERFYEGGRLEITRLNEDQSLLTENIPIK